MRKHEIAFGFVILKKKKSSLKDIRENNENKNILCAAV
jgi:hypothetical protein